MKINMDALRVSQNAIDKDGRLAEPEEQLVQRVIGGVADTKTALGDQVAIPGQEGIPTQVIVESGNAGSMALSFRWRCGQCKHFDNKRFVEWMRQADHPTAPPDHREAVNEIRAGLLMTMNATVQEMHVGQDGEMDVEHALASCGWCHALGAHYKDNIGVHPFSTCPMEVITPQSPQGFFQPRDGESRKLGDAAYDAVIRTAQGK